MIINIIYIFFSCIGLCRFGCCNIRRGRRRRRYRRRGRRKCDLDILCSWTRWPRSPSSYPPWLRPPLICCPSSTTPRSNLHRLPTMILTLAAKAAAAVAEAAGTYLRRWYCRRRPCHPQKPKATPFLFNESRIDNERREEKVRNNKLFALMLYI